MADWYPQPLESAYQVSSSYAATLSSSAASKFWKFSKGGDRKSVVEGKSVDLGVRRIIKQNKFHAHFTSENRFVMQASVLLQWINM